MPLKQTELTFNATTKPTSSELTFDATAKPTSSIASSASQHTAKTSLSEFFALVYHYANRIGIY